MLKFKTIELEDKDIIESYLKHQNYRVSDLSFTNLFAWSNKYNTKYATTDDWLFIRFLDNNGRSSYLMPVGTGDLKEAIELIIEDHQQFDNVFQLRGLTEEMIEKIEAVLPDTFDYSLNRSVSDYIYTSEKLIHLRGKKLQSKRNHINRFKRENEWKYVSLTGKTTEVIECKRMLQEWMEENGEEKDPSIVFEQEAIKLMLHNFEELGLKGGFICVDGDVAAFTLGKELSEDTFVVHVEKAFTDIHGAYTIVNQQFVEHDLSEYKYINREEDMGLESLRKAKLSYQPDIILKKHVARFKEDK